jgi:two-component system sensor histidine kinase VicK
MLGSLAVLLVVLVAGSAYQLHGFSSTSILEILPYFMVLTAITLVLTRIVLGGRRERLSLNEKIVKTEYEHERLVALINSMSEAVIATDEAGKITIYNAAALDLLDTNSELTGKLISECLRLTDSTKKSVDIMQVAKQTRYILRRTDLMLPVNDTDQMALDINISRVSMTAAIVKQEGYTFLMRDITAQKSLDEERDLFISEVSHELRTPITIAEANISMANLQATKPDRDEDALVGSIDKAHKQVLFLADMVNDLSTLSRASRDDKSMDVDTFSIREIILELARTYAPQADKKGLYLKANVEFKLPEVTSSKLYLKEILQNFVTNAIKYTKEGGITVRAHAHNEQTLAITIHDTGIGISKSEITKVFEKFWRSEDPYTRQTSGTGLGLYITSKLAGRIGAEITVESTVGEGTTFGILLPVIAVKTVDQKKVANDQVAHIFE